MDVAVEAVVWLISWFFLAYFALVNGSYLFVHLVSIVTLQRGIRDWLLDPVYHPHNSPFLPGIAVIVPAYNEEVTIVDTVQSLLNLEYSNHEIVVVNDGSRDETLEQLISTFELEPVGEDVPFDLPCETVHEVYQSSRVDLVVIDKDNGGKADALNAGVFFTDQPLFCAIDADSIIERNALLEVVQPFLRDPERMIASGGAVRVANGCSITRGVITDIGLSRSHLANLQTVEYLRAFLSGRIGLSGLGSLLIISGAFGLFRTSTVREVGGYSTETITEDMELIVRLQKHVSDEKHRITFVPYPVVWTEVPERRAVLARQRGRWFKGMLETLWVHRRMIGNPKYGMVGLFALPFFLFVEALGPLIEGLGYIIVPAAFLLGYLNVPFFVVFLGVAVGVGTLLSWLSVLNEVVSFRRYRNPRDIALLLLYGLLEHVPFRQWKSFITWVAFVQYLRGETSWGEMSRLGFDR
ncbi:glycosyltransferase family protein [Natrialba magadii ATCC 43099]|uniref:Family 2 glycosyl transferase n=1 Tax=Natrialba magadii (strain ATCC 43099 / DSM 3394 / CCM 3739 / CIP 104546 / IAM 13178 / JCM 8861 / NBRC 102185 / NCIMB 2190 / MS3) TaxID=547559 RepID=D3SRL1_NATMM|nr:glycosyltransferase family 2 protein [Natrialba magadii]ADD04716.1 glycosyltransferase family protein [Natrialba magadii ATCC 43099]ELY25372.1 family 2 glycosyl transferase [Natrialba magadii ATCC 43099]